MEGDNLKLAYFDTLREEIKETKARIFRIIMVTILGFSAYMFFATSANLHAIAVAPFAILVLMVLYLTEQNELMRAARYILEKVEASEEHWERWVASHQLRGPERWFFAFFVIVFLVFYATALSVAMHAILTRPPDDTTFDKVYWNFAAPIAYGVGTLWALAALGFFWRSSTSTT